MAAQWRRQIRWLAILAIAFPAALLAALATRLNLLKGTADLTAADVERYLEDFLDGGGGDWDWDDFTSIPITDPSLDRIRDEASLVELPLTGEGEATLRQLLDKVRAMKRLPAMTGMAAAIGSSSLRRGRGN
jgi:hypothetical protein